MDTVTIPATLRAAIINIAKQSKLARHDWKDRGRAPIGYVKGMALAYAGAVLKLQQNDPYAVEMAKAASPGGAHDALAWYEPEFAAHGMANNVAGVDTLRHLFVLLTGLGMRESSGRACEGRDRSAENKTADTAEAGLFQSSYNLAQAHPLLPTLFAHYAGSTELLDVFMEGVKAKPADLENYGSGAGAEFQRLTKACPAFAVAFAAVGLRNNLGHWGPIKRKAAEVLEDCDAMFREIQSAILAQGAPG